MLTFAYRVAPSRCARSATPLTAARRSHTTRVGGAAAAARLLACGRLIGELEGAGLPASVATAVGRILYLRHDASATREAFTVLDLRRSGVLPMVSVRRLLCRRGSRGWERRSGQPHV